ncbi:MAG: hypothetical protein A2636_00645 [Elusimicrobia bacterium RIFCSPHIGHO2_01_FULL_64_10]|nr:MAG: hypothetical protein A2636_00645 [Elusimicrobia bacterium RIFCSPHIGHO2_01_FULL_64_10]
MIRWAIRILVVIAGPTIGWFQISQSTRGILAGVVCALLIILAEIIIERIPLDNLVAGVLGGILGLIAGKMLDYGLYIMDNPTIYARVHRYSLLINVLLTYLGMVVAIRKKDEVELLDRNIFVPSSKKKAQEVLILDTSVIIDGRIVDVCEARFLPGRILVPRFVLNELHTLSDSGDNTKRQRGRRGLDVLTKLQEMPDNPVTIFEKDFSALKNVDAKLVELAKDLTAKIVTTDFNLNKVATLQGIGVLNINDLANALKAVVLPGEGMTVFVVKEGKERDQGVAYMDDGTMVVVEEGRRFVGKKAEVVVSSILQTSAGRMIFTKAKDHGPSAEQPGR